MMRFMLWLLALLALGPSIARAECPTSPTKDFGRQAAKYLDQKTYVLLGERHDKCLYFRDVSFKNGQGQQAIVLANSKGRCIGFFRTSLASGAELDGEKLTIHSSDGLLATVDLSKSVPNFIFYDGEKAELEKCIK